MNRLSRIKNKTISISIKLVSKFKFTDAFWYVRGDLLDFFFNG